MGVNQLGYWLEKGYSEEEAEKKEVEKLLYK